MAKKREPEWWFNRYIDFIVAHGRLSEFKPYDGRYKIIYGKDSIYIQVVSYLKEGGTNTFRIENYRWDSSRPRIITKEPERNHGHDFYLTRKNRTDSFIRHFHWAMENKRPCPVCGFDRWRHV